MPSRKERRQQARERKAVANIEAQIVEASPQLVHTPTPVSNAPSGSDTRPTRSITFTGFQGPLPPPELLREYADIVPNGAERIFRVFEKQVDNRITLEQRVITGGDRRANWGVICAFAIGIFGLATAGVVAVSGHEFAASVIGGATLASLVSTFVVGTRSRREERVEKSRAMTGRR